MRKQTGDLITSTNFEEVNLLSKTRNNVESGDESDDNSIMSPLLSEDEMYAMDSVNDSDDESMSTEMLDDIIDGSQYHPNVNRRE